jgi:hypothetical protein
VGGAQVEGCSSNCCGARKTKHAPPLPHVQYLVVDYLRMQGMLHPQGLLGEPTACSFLHRNAHAWLVADLGFPGAGECRCCSAPRLPSLPAC